MAKTVGRMAATEQLGGSGEEPVISNVGSLLQKEKGGGWGERGTDS